MTVCAPLAAALLLICSSSASATLWGRRRTSVELPVYEVVPHDLLARGRGALAFAEPLCAVRRARTVRTKCARQCGTAGVCSQEQEGMVEGQAACACVS